MMARRALLVLVGAAAAWPAWAHDTPDAAEVQAEVERVAAAFLKEAGTSAAGVRPPKVIVEFTPQLMWVDVELNELHTATWDQSPPELQAAISGLLGRNPPLAPSEFFYEVFNSFLIPHEMAHLVDFARDRLHAPGSLYANEFRANRAAVAFWLTQPGVEARLQRLMGAIDTIMSSLPSPVPAGADAGAFFEQNYEQLGASFEGYGWYQFRMFLDAWAERRQKTLPEILAEES